jgi:large subunit ribosomal protein L3
VPPGAFFNEKMLNTILASKGKMSQTFVGEKQVSITQVKAGPCVVTQIKTQPKDGYWAVQLGFGEKKVKRLTKPVKGHLKGALKDKRAPRFLREVRLSQEPDFKVGDHIKVGDIFSPGDKVRVTGITKGKGFAGVVKRWGFAGGPRTHGQSDRLRAPGSIGQGTTPGRVRKGKKMAGRMGGKKRAVMSKVILVDSEKNEMQVAGPVSGNFGGLLVIEKLAQAQKENTNDQN